MTANADFPQRIVCLTEETTETLYLLGEDWRIVGISGFTVRPARARREKPRVSAFTSARIERIVGLQPDLVLGFSDLQADIAAALARAGLEVHVFNHRSVADILADAGSAIEQSTRARCTAWLRETLTEPKRSADLEDEAKELGYPSRTLKRARAKLGIRAEKRADGWWVIPPSQEEGHAII